MTTTNRTARKARSALARFDHRMALLSGQPCCYSAAWREARAAERQALVAAVEAAA